jgi:hypothetical protein
MIKRGKRAQITLFIIIAIVLVAGVVVFTVIKPFNLKTSVSKEEGMKIVSSQMQPIRNLVEKCVKEVSTGYFKATGLHAGYYYYQTLRSFDFAGPKTIIAYKDSNNWTNILPSLGQIANQFQTFLQNEGYDKIDNCTQKFKQYKKVLDDVKYNDKNITANIRPDDILVNINWPITLSRGEASSTLQDQQVLLLIPLGRAINFANNIIDTEMTIGPFRGIIFDNYLQSHTQEMKTMKLDDVISYPTSDDAVIVLKSIPYRLNEEEFKFYFALSRVTPA